MDIELAEPIVFNRFTPHRRSDKKLAECGKRSTVGETRDVKDIESSSNEKQKDDEIANERKSPNQGQIKGHTGNQSGALDSGNQERLSSSPKPELVEEDAKTDLKEADNFSPDTSTSLKKDDKKDCRSGLSEEVSQNNESEVSTSKPSPVITTSTPVSIVLHPRKRMIQRYLNMVSAVPTVQETTAETQVHPHEPPNQAPENDESETSVSTTSSNNTSTPVPPVLHHRKRKIKQNNELITPLPEVSKTFAETQVHPHEPPTTNCYQQFLHMRNQINKRHRDLYPVQLKPPRKFKDYLMNRYTYVLASTTPAAPNITYPPSLPPQMKDLFAEQEKERYRLETRHVVEKEKLILSVEQEVLRVHGRKAMALANQSLPFSVCTVLNDQEVYNLITPKQEEDEKNVRSRYNGRVFLSWLRDLDDKWEKTKDQMLRRHHNEAESLHVVQQMDWEWKLKELKLCDWKSTPKIEDTHVPMVYVSKDFDLLPA